VAVTGVIGKTAATHGTPESEGQLSKQLEVNLLAPMRLVSGLLPVMRPGSRIINIGSGESYLSTPVNGAYAIGKHALEAFSNTARFELASYGIFVSLVMPGATRTAMYERKKSQYEELLARPEMDQPDIDLVVGRSKITDKLRVGDDLDRVARVVVQALSAHRPRARYFVG
jgi:NAD(P)-dependent dehydrogenase (short-subunit alcohol dehydrogenase family)